MVDVRGDVLRPPHGMHFYQLRKAHDDPVLTLGGTPVPVVEETKFLGVIFYKKKTYVYTPY